MSTKRLTLLSLLIALYVVLSILTPIKLQNFKFTFEALPILLTGFLFGPLDGLVVGALGSFLYQLLFSGYGLTITTFLWILPHALSGLLVGGIAKKLDYKLTNKQIILTCILSALTVTAFNTLALLIDSKLYGYYSKALVFASIPAKVIVGIILAICYTLIMPTLLKALKKVIKK